MADLDNISRLQQEQQKTLEDCELMIEKWEKFKEDYVSIDNLLSGLPKKTTHEVMVPMGSLAFMPGNLIHTNEIMVLLGDNWFAERSASQAVEIAKRRLKNVEDYLKNLHEEHKNILSHIAFTSDIANVKSESDFKEIKEELSEEDRQILGRRTRRVAYSKATKDSVKKVDLKNFTKAGKSSKCTNNNDVFARLEELERQERVNDEMDNIEEETFNKETFNIDEEDVTSVVDQKTTKKVKWKKSIAEEKEIEIVAVPKVEKATIKFSHSSEKITQEKDNNERQDITSPADIFTDYLTKKASKVDTQPRSILKHSNNNEIFTKQDMPVPINTVNGESLKRNPDEILPKLEEAFSDVVLEHKDVENPVISTQKEQQHETRTVSKFKARRMKKNME